MSARIVPWKRLENWKIHPSFPSRLILCVFFATHPLIPMAYFVPTLALDIFDKCFNDMSTHNPVRRYGNPMLFFIPISYKHYAGVSHAFFLILNIFSERTNFLEFIEYGYVRYVCTLINIKYDLCVCKSCFQVCEVYEVCEADFAFAIWIFQANIRLTVTTKRSS